MVAVLDYGIAVSAQVSGQREVAPYSVLKTASRAHRVPDRTVSRGLWRSAADSPKGRPPALSQPQRASEMT